MPTGGTPAAGTWWLSILDNTDRAGVLGHHDLTPDGLPVGKSFAGTDKHYGHSWTVTASHELLEMLADPDINLSVFVHPSKATACCTPTKCATPARTIRSATTSTA